MLLDYWTLREIFLSLEYPILAKSPWNAPTDLHVLIPDHLRLIGGAAERAYTASYYAEFNLVCTLESSTSAILGAQLFSLTNLRRFGIDISYAELPTDLAEVMLHLIVRYRISPAEALGVAVAYLSKYTYVVRDDSYMSKRLWTALDRLSSELDFEWDYLHASSLQGGRVRA